MSMRDTCEKCGKNPVGYNPQGYDTQYCEDCRDNLMEHPPKGHTHSTGYDSDERCECGKWLEYRYYEWLDHIEDVDANGWDR